MSPNPAAVFLSASEANSGPKDGSDDIRVVVRYLIPRNSPKDGSDDILGEFRGIKYLTTTLDGRAADISGNYEGGKDFLGTRPDTDCNL